MCVPDQGSLMNDLGQVPNGLALVPNLHMGIPTKPASWVVVRLRQDHVPWLLLLEGTPWDQQGSNTCSPDTQPHTLLLGESSDWQVWASGSTVSCAGKRKTLRKRSFLSPAWSLPSLYGPAEFPLCFPSCPLTSDGCMSVLGLP